MLLDVIGILIAFVAVLLLLSLLVTALVQATQYVFRLRGRNLERGIAALLKALPLEKVGADLQGTARKVMKSDALVPLWREGGIFSIFTRVLGPKITWLTQDELKLALKDAGQELTDKGLATLGQLFPRMEVNASNRFLSLVRWITLAWSVAVAALFQVSAPEILSAVSRNKDLRDRLVAAAERALPQAEVTLKGLAAYESVSEAALEELSKRHPDLTSLLEQASGIGKDKSEILKELDGVLKSQPEKRAAVLKEYGEILDALREEKLDAALTQVTNITGMLGTFDLKPWPKGSKFFYGDSGLKGGAILGVLLTAVLLSFGAPFWFNQLKNLVSLRDLIVKLESSRTEETVATAKK